MLGFLDKGHDIDGTIDALGHVLIYSTLIGIYNEWHPRLFGPLSGFKWSGAGGRAYLMRYVQEKIAQFTSKPKPAVEQGSLKTQTFLEKMTLARDKDPEKVTDYHVFMMGLSNIIAGSDTTAISLSAILYHLLHNPPVLANLRAEIDEFTRQGRCSERVTFKESQDMPYFQAVMKEALRMHSATGLPFWRVVPPGGAELSGHFFPEGAVVGVNAWVYHYDEAVFPDAKRFRPERWIEAEEDPARLKVMNEIYMPVRLIQHSPLPGFFVPCGSANGDCSSASVQERVLESISPSWKCRSLFLVFFASLISLRRKRHGIRRISGSSSRRILASGFEDGRRVLKKCDIMRQK
jgi:hypothetical protein